jgi:hypothetical protein
MTQPAQPPAQPYIPGLITAAGASPTAMQAAAAGPGSPRPQGRPVVESDGADRHLCSRPRLLSRRRRSSRLRSCRPSFAPPAGFLGSPPRCPA